MPEYDFNFHLAHYSSAIHGPAWTTGSNDINLSIKRIMVYSKEHGVSFEKFFSECISHEVIHNVLRHLEGYKPYSCFDLICAHKQQSIFGKLNFKTWHGGIPWWTK